MKSKLARKYILIKSDGTEFDEDAKYFVLRYDAEAEYGFINRTVLRKWCEYTEGIDELVELSRELIEDINYETDNVYGGQKEIPFEQQITATFKLGELTLEDFDNE